MQPGISGRDDCAHGLLVKAFVALAALEIFQMAADRAVVKKFPVLLGVDPPLCESSVGTMPRNRPALSGSERLPEERKIRERRHGLDASLSLDSVTQRVKIELRLEVMHPSFENRFAVQGDP